MSLVCDVLVTIRAIAALHVSLLFLHMFSTLFPLIMFSYYNFQYDVLTFSFHMNYQNRQLELSLTEILFCFP